MQSVKEFEKLGISTNVLKALKKKGFKTPTPIQKKVIPVFLEEDRDIIGQAQTGTGKTAAFGIPLIERLKEKTGHVQALILVPTRELAIQVAEEVISLRGNKRLFVLPIYGGQSIRRQWQYLKRGVDIVVGTPGRILDHLGHKSLKLHNLSYFILDEADEMLNMGFIDDIKEILKSVPLKKRMLLFSATMPETILHIAQKYMNQPVLITAKAPQTTPQLTTQVYYEVSPHRKFDVLCRIIDMEEGFYGLVFCKTKRDVDEIAARLIQRGYNAGALHGGLSQRQRERILNKFKKRWLNVLVATDVAARGIDISNLTHVINYALPEDPAYYIHRIGRTGRAGKEGKAISLVTFKDYKKLHRIKSLFKITIKKKILPKLRTQKGSLYPSQRATSLAK